VFGEEEAKYRSSQVGKPERSKGPRKQCLHPDLNPQGAERGRLSDGDETDEAPIESQNRFSREVQDRKGAKETSFRFVGRRKAL